MKIRVIFDGPPSHESGRFVECENEQGQSIRAGEWVQDQNGLWALEIEQVTLPDREALIAWLRDRSEMEPAADLADALLAWLKDQPAPKEPPR